MATQAEFYLHSQGELSQVPQSATSEAGKCCSHDSAAFLLLRKERRWILVESYPPLPHLQTGPERWSVQLRWLQPHRHSLAEESLEQGRKQQKHLPAVVVRNLRKCRTFLKKLVPYVEKQLGSQGTLGGSDAGARGSREGDRG